MRHLKNECSTIRTLREGRDVGTNKRRMSNVHDGMCYVVCAQNDADLIASGIARMFESVLPRNIPDLLSTSSFNCSRSLEALTEPLATAAVFSV